MSNTDNASEIDQEESYSSEGSESPVDDAKKDPSYKGKGTVVPSDRKTRYKTQLQQIYPNGKGKKAIMGDKDKTKGSVGSG